MEGYQNGAGASTNIERSRMQRAALRYGDRGIPVFPCKPRTKEPATPNGFYDATSDRTRLNGFFNAHPGANIAMRTGAASGIAVVDLDERTPEALALWEKLPPTLTVRTKRGEHRWYRIPDGVEVRARKLAPGLDLKAEGGYVMVPPSVHHSGARYAFAEETRPLGIASAPEWLLALLRAPSKALSGEVRRAPLSAVVPDGEPIPEGGRNHELTRIAGRLHDGPRDLAALEADLLAINEARCVPPLPDDEVRKIAASIHRREPCNPAPTADPEALAALDDIEAAFWRREWKGMGGKGARDLAVVLIKEARKHGRLIPAGVRVVMSVRSLALAAGMSRRSALRGIPRLKAAGVLRQDNAHRTGTVPGAFVLLAAPAATRHHSTTTGVLRTPSRLVVTPCRAPLSAARLRWTKVLRERVGDDYEVVVLRRIGKSGGHVMDLLEAAGGSMKVGELAGAMGIKRSRDLTRRATHPGGRDGVVARLENAGVVRVEGDTITLTLTDDWLEALNEERERAGEIDDYRRDLKRYEREREAYRERHRDPAEAAPTTAELDARRVAREAAGAIRELERVDPADPFGGVGDLYALVDRRVKTSRGTGVLWQVLSGEVRVVLDENPNAWVAIPHGELLGAA